MNKKSILILGIVLFSLNYSCKKNKIAATPPAGSVTGSTTGRSSGPPNIIFLLADDMGYEMPTFDGGQSYVTTHLDSLAANSMVFNECRATPLCSPSRVQLLSGLYNFRNYLKYGWGHYDSNFTTYANILQKNGYTTCALGKWQLANWDIGIPAIGFDNYCILDAVGNLYKSPIMRVDGGFERGTATANKYSEDIVSDYVGNFIDQNKDKPFFIYYAFSLIHEPDQPTPLDANFISYDESVNDTIYIKSMTHYLDLKVGALMSKLKADGLDKNTVIVFTGDNGSEVNFHSLFRGRLLEGEKGSTTELGTHVPLFVNWPGHITPGSNNNLIDFSDFAPTFLDMARISTKPPGLDGISFYPQLFGQNQNIRSWIYCYFDPFPVALPLQPQTHPITYAQDKEYKLYKTDQMGTKAGQFFHFTQDMHEQHPLQDSELTPGEVAIKQKLQTVLAGRP